MHTLLSIFHLLLMLTHSRVLPDMSAVWKEIKTEISGEQQERKNPEWEIPADQTIIVRSEAVRGDDKEKPLPGFYSQDPILPLLARQVARWPRRQTVTGKLYLVLCQMKTDG